MLPLQKSSFRRVFFFERTRRIWLSKMRITNKLFTGRESIIGHGILVVRAIAIDEPLHVILKEENSSKPEKKTTKNNYRKHNMTQIQNHSRVPHASWLCFNKFKIKFWRIPKRKLNSD